MKVAILAGGHGTRIVEETQVRPKPMVEIGGLPILWHILMHYSAHGYSEFVIALGYKGEYIKKYFADYSLLTGDLTINIGLQRQSHLARTSSPTSNRIGTSI